MDRKEKFGVLNVVGLNVAEKNYLLGCTVILD